MTIGRLSGTRAIWFLAALALTATAAIYVSVLPALEPTTSPLRLPWWAIALGFGLCEAWAVHLSFRRSTQSFTMAEAMVVPALALASPQDVVIASLVGPALALAWRNPPHTTALAVARFGLGSALAVVVYHVLLSGGDPTSLAGWGAALAGMAASCLCGQALLAAAHSLTEGNVDWPDAARMLRFDAMITLALTCVGLAVTSQLVVEPRGALLLIVPGAILMLASRSYFDERRRRERLEFLYDATHALSRSTDVGQALLDMLSRSRVAFRAEVAEAVLLPAAGAPRRIRLWGGEPEAMAAVGAEAASALRSLAEAGGVRMVEAGRSSTEVGAYLEDAGIHGPAMLAVLEADDRPLGLILIANRATVDGSFGASDLDLLEKLASNAAASLHHESLEEDFGRLESLQTQLEHMAFHDPLTALPNRARFIDQVSHALMRREALVAALFIDLDDFKTVNDSMGHRAGDELLVSVADRLRASLRAHDTPARLGGDEFAVLVEDGESMEVVLEIAERVLASLDAPFALGEGEVRVRASIGVATSLEGVRRAEDLVRNADLAMYRAKGQGKGCVELFESEMHALAVERHELKSELQRAVEEDQFVVLYQPVVDLQDGRIAGVEALVRWMHPRRGLVSPDSFIPLAEEAGLIGAIGRNVLAKACERLSVWRRASLAGDDFSLNLNLSVREFQAADLVEHLKEAAATAGVPTTAITIEITESALMDELETGVERMDLIKAAGFRLALDDFGTGYSSLSHLRRFPIDVLKIAKPFVDHIADRTEDTAYLRSILELARTLSLDVIVEGVETPDQAQILLGMGVRRVQGFVFSRPVEDRALSALLTLTPLQGFADEGIEPGGHEPVADLISGAHR